MYSTHDLINRYLNKGYPNTYTLTKALAEELIHSYRNKFPINVIRPSVVMASCQEPFPGWIEGFNGATGLIAGISKGVIRSICLTKNCTLKYVPVDMLVNATIVSAVKRTTMKSSDIFYSTCTDSPESSMSFKFLRDNVIKNSHKNPFNSMVWYPMVTIFENTVLFKVFQMLLHFLPALLVDVVKILTGNKMT